MNRIHYLFCFFAFLVLALIISCEETPEEIVVASVSVSQTSAEMVIGDTMQLTVSVQPSNATDKTVSWVSSKQSVASVSNTGLVTAISEGNSVISALAGGKLATCTITVSKGIVAVTSVELNKSTLELVEGDSESLTATVKPADATSKTVTWSTSDASVATVEGGKVTAIKEGAATITAKAGDKSAECRVTVAKKVIAVTSVELNKSTLELVEGDSESLTATVKPDDATDKTVTWSTSDATVATVDGGKVSAIKEGTATITAKAGEKSAECRVTVDVPNTIKFADDKVKEICIENWDSNQDGKLSYSEAASVKGIRTIFSSTQITSFEELQYFTGIEEIGYRAFYETYQLIRIVLPPNIKRIGDFAFCNSTITSLIIPETVTHIGEGSFRGAYHLSSVKLPKNLASLGQYSFNACSKLESVVLPNTISEISNGTFALCRNLKEIVIPDSVTSIGFEAFSACEKIESLTLPNSVKSIGARAFANSGLKSIKLPEALQVIKYLTFGGCTNLSSIEIPSSVKTIEYSVFLGCTSLSSVVIPSSIKSIGVNAFYHCVNLSFIRINATTPPILDRGETGSGAHWFDDTNNCPIYVPAESVEEYKTADYWNYYADRIQSIPE